MKIYLYSYFNTEASFHGPIMCFQVTPEEMSKDFVQCLASMDDLALKSLVHDDLYYLGTFDNVSGEIEVKHDFLLHVFDYASILLSKREKVKEVKDDGQSESRN